MDAGERAGKTGDAIGDDREREGEQSATDRHWR